MKTNYCRRLGLILSIPMIIGLNTMAQTGQKITDSNCQAFYPCLMGDKFFYMGKTNQSGYEPWVCYKNGKGAYLIKDIKSGSASGMDQLISNNSYGFRVLNGICYFFADDGLHGMELWKTDGTSAGTVMIKDINIGAGGYSGKFTSELPLNGNIIFYANDGIGFDLWKTDGTAQGTVKISNNKFVAIPYLGSSVQKNTFVVSNNKMFFFVNQALQVLDGTTFSVSSLESNGSWTPANLLIPFQNQIYFFRQTGNIASLWSTNGTLTNTRLIKNNLYTAVYNGNTLLPLRAAGSSNYMYIEMKLTTKGNSFTSELWKSDGTGPGTEIIKAFNSKLNEMIFIKDKLYFSAYLDNLNNGIWVSGGAAENTSLLYSYSLSNNTSSFRNLNDSLIFYKYLGLENNAVFLTDGTLNGTKKILDINSVSDIFVDSAAAYVFNGHDIYRYPAYVPTAIQETIKNNEISIYPNPTSDFIKIDSPVNFTVKIYNLTGQKILTVQDQKIINLEKYQPGIYFVNLEIGKEIITRKLIKK